MTGRIKSEKAGKKITFLPAQWKECRWVSTAILETDAKLVEAKMSLPKKNKSF